MSMIVERGGGPGGSGPLGPAGSAARRRGADPIDLAGAAIVALAFLALLGALMFADTTVVWAVAAVYGVAAVLLAVRVAQRHPFVPFVLPGLTMYLIFGVFPTIQAFRYSLYDWSGIGEPVDFVGLKNFVTALTSPVVYNAAWHNVELFLAVFVLQNTIALGLALTLHSKPKGFEAYRAILFSPVIISLVATGLIWQVMFGSNIGLVTPLLQMVGLGVLVRDWLGDPYVTFWLLVLVQFWQWLGLPMIIYLAGLQSVPEELMAAGRIDGATELQVFRFITFPLLAPAFTVVSGLSFITMFRTFDIPFVMAGPGGAPSGTTDVLSLVVFRTAFGMGGTAGTSMQQGYAVAIGVVMFLVILAVSTLQMVVLRRREQSL
jgi:raffinose/stachyose/melibiose transport system permease protein